MSYLKKVIFTLFAVFLLWQSFELVSKLMPSEVLDVSKSLVNAFLINLYITGIFAFPGFVFPTHKLIGSAYYKLRNPKVLKKIYWMLGVSYFRKILLAVFWGKKKNKSKFFNGTKGGLQHFIYQSKQSEFGHMGAMVIILGISLMLLIKGHITMALLTMAINFIGNFYPILLQRYHRIRIERISKKFKA